MTDGDREEAAALADWGEVHAGLVRDLLARIRALSREIAEHKAICDALPLAVALAQAKDQLAAAEADADRLADSLEHITELFVDLAPLGEDTLREVAVVNARQALTAHQARKG